MTSDDRVSRREWLAACGGAAGGLAGLAGCLGGGSDDGNDDSGGDGNDGSGGDGNDGGVGDGSGDGDGDTFDPSSTWPTVDADAKNTGHTPGASGPTGDAEAIWTFDTDRDSPPEFSATPAVADGTVYVGTMENTFYAVDAADGSQVWSADLQSQPTGVCTVDGDVVYVPATEHVFALDRTDGGTVWTHDVGEHAADAPTLYEGSLYWIGELGDDPERTTITTFDHDEYGIGAPSSTPALSGGYAYVAAHEHVKAIDLDSGETDWTFSPEESIRMDVGQVAVADGTVYAPTFGRPYTDGELAGVFAIDAESGTEEWRATEGFANTRQGVSYADGTVFVGGDVLHALDADDGTRRWEAPGRTVPSIADGVVYAFGPEGLTGVDADSGDVVLQRDIPVDRTGYRQQVAVVDGTLVYQVGPRGVVQAVSSA